MTTKPITTATKRPDEQPGWDDASLADPHHDTAKADRVNAMFASIAERYDLNNRIHSLGQDRAWRRRAVLLARVRPRRDQIVDVACGTGDLALCFAEWSPASVIGIDFVGEMIRLARQKTERRARRGSCSACGVDEATGKRLPWQAPEFRHGDALHLDLPEASADIVSIAFGIRNVTDPRQALVEFRRILRPGGRLVILEFSFPRNPLLRFLYRLYSERIMPITATWISGDKTGAYRYLPRSVSTFCNPEEMVRLLAAAGFSRISIHPMSLGICTAFLAHIPISESTTSLNSDA